MKFRFFAIAAQMPESEALNTFCARHRIVSVEKQFVAQSTESFWSVCVTYLDGVKKQMPFGRLLVGRVCKRAAGRLSKRRF